MWILLVISACFFVVGFFYYRAALKFHEDNRKLLIECRKVLTEADALNKNGGYCMVHLKEYTGITHCPDCRSENLVKDVREAIIKDGRRSFIGMS